MMMMMMMWNDGDVFSVRFGTKNAVREKKEKKKIAATF